MRGDENTPLVFGIDSLVSQGNKERASQLIQEHLEMKYVICKISFEVLNSFELSLSPPGEMTGEPP